MPSIRNARHKATKTSQKNTILLEKISNIYREIINEYGRDNVLLWREVNKRKKLDKVFFKEDIEKGEKAIPEKLAEKLDEELSSNRRFYKFIKLIEANTGVRKLYDIDKRIEIASKNK